MYDFIIELIGTVPTEFKFVYTIGTVVLSTLILSFLFSLFYIPIMLIRK